MRLPLAFAPPLLVLTLPAHAAEPPIERSPSAPPGMSPDDPSPDGSSPDDPSPDSSSPETRPARAPETETPEGTARVPGRFIVEDEPEPPPDPPPETVDTLGGHVLIGAMGGLALPFGSLQQGIPQTEVFSSGGYAALDIGLGVSRTTVLGVSADVSFLGADPQCTDACAARSFAAGAFVRYHLVQGLSFDPWASAGIGWRQTRFEDDITYSGLDWARLLIGGDWYFIDHLGIGPVLGLTATTFLSRSEGAFAGPSVAMTFFIGGRIVFDTPGK
jgi:hypothetical protein